MEFKDLVSVVMPVHNGEQFLREAIDGILSQSYSNFELLIIENCSSDSSLEIINSYSDSRIKLIFEEDCGIVQAYNRGFKESRGQYVVVHDQDDISSQTRIEAQIKFLKKNNLDLSGSSFTIVNENGDLIKNIFPPVNQNAIIGKILFNFFTLYNPTIIVKKNVLQELNYFDLSYKIGSDYEFILRSLKNYKCGNNPELLVSYRLHSSNSSRRNKTGGEIVRNMSLDFFEQFKPNFRDADFILSRIHFFYGNYYKSSIQSAKSIFKNGLHLYNITILLLSTIFVLPVLIMRKRGLYYNRFINRIMKVLRINY